MQPVEVVAALKSLRKGRGLLNAASPALQVLAKLPGVQDVADSGASNYELVGKALNRAIARIPDETDRYVLIEALNILGRDANLTARRSVAAETLGYSADWIREQEGKLLPILATLLTSLDRPHFAAEPDAALDDALLEWIRERYGFDARQAIAMNSAASASMQTLSCERLSQILRAYYGSPPADWAWYSAHFRSADIDTPILAYTGRAPTMMPMQAAIEARLRQQQHELPLEVPHMYVLRRISHVASGRVLTNHPSFSLMGVTSTPKALLLDFSVAPFFDYAFTLDLLEEEIATTSTTLRDRWLPDARSITDVRRRLCLGGIMVLTALARPAEFGAPGDFGLLVQRRSDRVLNVGGRLSVIPKCFHQPLNDYRRDVHPVRTVLRELEEELLGRDELDDLSEVRRHAAIDPLAPSNLTAPGRWILEHIEQGTVRLVFTGFGINTVSGNFEIACLLVVEDVTFWTQFGHQLSRNWEASGVEVVSSLDVSRIDSLSSAPDWSPESVFALAEGLRAMEALYETQPEL